MVTMKTNSLSAMRGKSYGNALMGVTSLLILLLALPVSREVVFDGVDDKITGGGVRTYNQKEYHNEKGYRILRTDHLRNCYRPLAQRHMEY
jgi:hypothetical protein